MKNQRLVPYLRLRRYLLLEQLDVSLATGIPVQRISLGERGRIAFNDVERRVLDNYFEERVLAFGYDCGIFKSSERIPEAANA